MGTFYVSCLLLCPTELVFVSWVALQGRGGLENSILREGAGRILRAPLHPLSSTVLTKLGAPHPLEVDRELGSDGQTWWGLGVWWEFSSVGHVWDKGGAVDTSCSEENKTGNIDKMVFCQ